ncbi:MAG: polysaccharide deacetylase family protein [Azospirillaceae bacterium]
MVDLPPPRRIPAHRNLYGYGPEPPAVGWPGGARVAVSLVLNVEEGSEQAVSRGDAVNEHVHDMVHEVRGMDDPAMESHFDYGARAGYWRIVRVLAAHGATCTINGCAEALEVTPWIARDAVARGFEIACHGDRWLAHGGLDEATERATIARAVARIERACGVRPVGWHTRCPHTLATRRLLVEEGGFTYDSDAYDDDLPSLIEVAGRPHVVLPYSLDTNDMRCQRPEAAFVTAGQFAEYVIDAFETLYEEGEAVPKMMTIGLHTRTIGRPGRIAGLQRVMAHLAAKPAGTVWFARRRDIADHWRAHAPVLPAPPGDAGSGPSS